VTARLVVLSVVLGVFSVVFAVIVVSVFSVVFTVSVFAVAVHPVEDVGRTRVRAYDRDTAEQRDDHDRGGQESEWECRHWSSPRSIERAGNGCRTGCEPATEIVRDRL
jgi:hypothetical protein